MICPLHPSVGELDVEMLELCPACKVGSPPDLGVITSEETSAEDKGPGQQ